MRIKQGKAPCPCGTKQKFESCCGPLIHIAIPATSPEALMRSRYTANVNKAFKYVADTWHPKSRPQNIVSNTKTPWLRLELINSKTEENKGWVEFKAFYGHSNHEHCLHEKSFFIFEENRWWYVDGEIIN